MTPTLTNSLFAWLLLSALVLGIGYIISTRRRVGQLRATLQQQQQTLSILRHEVSHRVNTNLSIVVSLLELQQTQTTDSTARQVLQQSLARIRSVAMLQERLYQDNVPTNVNLRQYVTALYQGLTQHPPATALQLNLETDTVDADMALPLGLILHELLADATHHASPRDPAITISFKRQNGWMLELFDQGPTLDTQTARWTRDGVALPKRLIEGLSEQVGGVCVMIPDKGMHFRLHISEPSPLPV